MLLSSGQASMVYIELKLVITFSSMNIVHFGRRENLYEIYQQIGHFDDKLATSDDRTISASNKSSSGVWSV